MDLDHFILPIGPIVPIIPRNPPIFGFSGIVSRTCNQGEMVYTFPLFSLPEPHFLQGRPKWAGGEGPFYQPVLIHDNKHAMQYLTQLELAGGLGVTLRLGINPGEIIDFFAGIFGFDIYLDDDVQKDKET